MEKIWRRTSHFIRLGEISIPRSEQKMVLGTSLSASPARIPGALSGTSTEMGRSGLSSNIYMHSPPFLFRRGQKDRLFPPSPTAAAV